MAKELQGLPGTQVRVVQNKEPLHFLALFQGKMVVRSGGVAAHGGFNHGSSSSSSSNDAVQLFHIRGTNAIDTRAVQVPAVATSLNSSDCFVLLTPGTAFEWRGRGSNASERSVADSLSRVVLSAGRKEVDVEEGSEPAEFWEALGGKVAYPSAKSLSDPTLEPRLFEVSASLARDKVVAEEIVDFAQSDLDQSNVYILDQGAEVAVWVGAHAPKVEQDAAVEMARQFVANAPGGRSKSTPIYRVPAGAEPPMFTAAFLGWNETAAADFSDPYERKMRALKAGSAGSSASSGSSSSAAVAPAAHAAVERVDASGSGASSHGKCFTLAELKAGVPAGVDAAKKETYLSDAEFKAALGTDRDAFAKLAGWKQAELKKKAGIF